MRALIIAFSTYSRVPMPRVSFSEKAMRYCMCFFPIVGLFIGAVEAALFYFLYDTHQVSAVAIACVLTVVPVLLTGGIHVDGYFDTIDARRSYKSKEEKLQILKDPHLGAFAVIYGIIYFLVYFGAMYEMLVQLGEKCLLRCAIIIAYVFVLERVLSGLSVVMFPKAKKDGMLATTASQADKAVATILIIIGLGAMSGALVACPLYAGIVTGVQLLMFAYYRYMSAKEFGGTTGDLAGYFLQMAELFSMLVIVGLAVF